MTQEITLKAGVTYAIIRRERKTSQGLLCEDVHIYFSNDTPTVIIDREFEGLTSGLITGVVK
jgi:hypothetical protein